MLFIQNDDLVDPNVSETRRWTFDELDFPLCSFLLFDVKYNNSFHDISNDYLILNGLYRLNKCAANFAVVLDEVEVVAMFQV